MPLGTGKEAKRDYRGGDPLWRVSGLSNLLGAPALGSDSGKMSPLGCLKGW